MNGRGAFWIALRELPAQRFEIPSLELGAYRSQRRGIVWRLEEAFLQDFEIETGAADDEWNVTSGPNGSDALQSIGGEAGGIVRRVELEDVEEMVRHRGALVASAWRCRSRGGRSGANRR
jgi:hypothetical protein